MARVLDPIEWVHEITKQIPDPYQHLTRSDDAYANRNQMRYRAEVARGCVPHSHPVAVDDRNDDNGGTADDADGAAAKTRRRNWARPLRKILEVDPILCPRCRTEMAVVAVITQAHIVDRILTHLDPGHGHDPFEARAPPFASSG